MSQLEEKLELVPSYGKGDKGRINFIPMMAMVALRVVKVSETKGGLILPDNAEGTYQTPQCEVLAVGPQVKFTKVGQYVRLSHQTLASKLWIGDATFVMVKEEQLYGIDHGVEESEYVKEAGVSKARGDAQALMAQAEKTVPLKTPPKSAK